MSGLTYDTGALLAAEHGDRRMWALHRRALERGRVPTVPAAVLVEAGRNRTEAARLLRGCSVESLDDAVARAAGLLLGRCTIAVDVTDATVAESALRRGDQVVTSDRPHLEALATAVDRRLGIIDI